MEKDGNTPVKIRRIAIRNYKGIDELELEFPVPRMLGDPDIIVMGSENGLGKTSVLECCALLLLALTVDVKWFELLMSDYHLFGDVPDLFIKAGSSFTVIDGDIVVGDESMAARIKITRNGIVEVSKEAPHRIMIEDKRSDTEHETLDFIKVICGSTPNPVMTNTFLLFHSYRKVQEGNPQLGMMVERGRPKKRSLFPEDFPMSAFKLRILHSLMGKANLFEFEEGWGPGGAIEKLNQLMQIYAGGTISKLRPSENNTVDIRIMPANAGESFTFDGLSSGQKEIISTLFLIWEHTKNNPSVVLIDEPELHLNAQWHRSFIKELVRMAPQNQYIMATHSEDVMRSVDKDRRLLLLNIREENT